MSNLKLAVPQAPAIFPNTAPENIQFQSESFHCLKLNSKIMFYVGSFPFNLEISEKGILSVKSSLAQKVIYRTLHILAVISYLLFWKDVFIADEKISENPAKVYDRAWGIVLIIGLLVFFYWVWFNPKGPYFLQESAFHILRPGKTRITWSLVLTGMLWTLALVEMSMPLYAAVTITVQAIKGDADSVKLFSVKSVVPLFANGTEEDHGPSKTAVAIFFLRQLMESFSFFCGNGASIITYVCCIVVNQIANEFDQFLTYNPDLTFKQISEAYKRLKSLLSNINKSVGMMVFITILGGLILLSSYFIKLLDENSIGLRVIIICHFVVFLGSIGLAADANSKFQMLSAYIFRRRKLDTFRGNQAVEILLNELSQNNLGLMAHTFTLSYSFLATILSSALTYIIILLQFQISAESRVGEK